MCLYFYYYLTSYVPNYARILTSSHTSNFPGTRETAFLDAIISAGIAREVARKCKEQELTACGCDFSVTGKIMESSTVIGGCGDNVKFSTEIAKQFTDPYPDNFTDCCNLTTRHNNKVGRKVSCIILYGNPLLDHQTM